MAAPSEVLTQQELAVSSAYEIAALVAVLGRKGIRTQREGLEEIRGSTSGKRRGRRGARRRAERAGAGVPGRGAPATWVRRRIV